MNNNNTQNAKITATIDEIVEGLKTGELEILSKAEYDLFMKFATVGYNHTVSEMSESLVQQHGGALTETRCIEVPVDLAAVPDEHLTQMLSVIGEIRKTAVNNVFSCVRQAGL